jgi:hypothetical protein
MKKLMISGEWCSPGGTLPDNHGHTGGEVLVLEPGVHPPQPQQDVRRELLQHTQLAVASWQAHSTYNNNNNNNNVQCTRI